MEGVGTITKQYEGESAATAIPSTYSLVVSQAKPLCFPLGNVKLSCTTFDADSAVRREWRASAIVDNLHTVNHISCPRKSLTVVKSSGPDSFLSLPQCKRVWLARRLQLALSSELSLV